MARKKSGDAGVESSIVVPFLKGAKSIDDKVSFLRSVQNNTSLSDYDRNLVGRALDRYSGDHDYRKSRNPEGLRDDPLRSPSRLASEKDYWGDYIVGGNVLRDYNPDEEGIKGRTRIIPSYGFKRLSYQDIEKLSDEGKIGTCRSTPDITFRPEYASKGSIALLLQASGRPIGAYTFFKKFVESQSGLSFPEFKRRIQEQKDGKRGLGHLLDNEGDSWSSSKYDTSRSLEWYNHHMETLDKELFAERDRERKPTQGLRNYFANDKLIQNGTYQASDIKYQPNNSFDNIKSQRNRTSQRVGVTMAVAGLGASIFFIGSNLTGNVIGSLSIDTTNLVGVGTFLIGIVGAMLCFRKK